MTFLNQIPDVEMHGELTAETKSIRIRERSLARLIAAAEQNPDIVTIGTTPERALEVEALLKEQHPSIKIYNDCQPPAPTAPPNYNAVLDVDRNYCAVDLLKHIPPNHLLSRYSRYVASLAHLPPSTVFLIGAAVYSAMASRKFCVLYPDGTPLPIGLYAVAEQPSGIGKSRCLKMFQKPFYAIRKGIYQTLQDELKQVNDALDTCGDDEKSELKKQHRQLAEKIKRFLSGDFVTNSTPEGLESKLTHTGGFFAAVSSEQGLFNSLLGVLYKSDGAANNNDIVLNGFDGGHVNSPRISREGYHGEVVGGIACFAQAGSIETVLKASNGTGLSERFLMLAEPNLFGKRDHTQTPEPDAALELEYINTCELIRSIFEEPRDFDDLSRLMISKEGFNAINQLKQRIEPHLADGGKFSHSTLRGAAAKIDMQVMKLAAILHITSQHNTTGNDAYQFFIADWCVHSAINIAYDLLEANLALCRAKGLLGIKAEFEAILAMFERDAKPKTERQIIMSRSTVKPFKDVAGNKSDAIRNALEEMAVQKLLRRFSDSSGKVAYEMAQ